MTVWLDDTTNEVVEPVRDPDGAIVSVPPNATAVPASIVSGVLVVMLRAETREHLHANMIESGVLVPVLDDEGEETGQYARGPGVCGLTEIGYPVLVRGEYDEEGNEITPPVMDDLYHANFWLDQATTAGDSWKAAARNYAHDTMSITSKGGGKAKRKRRVKTHTRQRKREVCGTYNFVEAVDPDTVATPMNRAQ